MTVERRLSKTQSWVVRSLVEQRERLASEVAEVNEALKEQLELLRQQYELPEGEYRFRGDREGFLLVRVGDLTPGPSPQPERGEGLDAKAAAY